MSDPRNSPVSGLSPASAFHPRLSTMGATIFCTRPCKARRGTSLPRKMTSSAFNPVSAPDHTLGSRSAPSESTRDKNWSTLVEPFTTAAHVSLTTPKRSTADSSAKRARSAVANASSYATRRKP